MHGVIETPTFLKDAAQSGVTDEARAAMVRAIANDPTMGDVMPGTGGARKVRFPGRGKGKSGGYRVVTFYTAEDVPVLLLALINKGERSDLSKAEQNALRIELSGFADEYRRSMRARAADLTRRRI